MDRLRVIAFGRPPGLIAAIGNGYFRAEHLEIDYTQTRSSGEQIRGLLAGKWEIAHTAVDNVLAYVDAEKADLFVVLVGDLGITQKLVVRPDISSFEGLRGKVLGLDALTTGYAFLLYRILALNGLAREDYRTVSVGGTAERLAALAAGRIDGALLGPPQDEAALAAGCHVLTAASAYFPAYPSVSVAARRSWAGRHRTMVVRYCRALLAGIRWAAAPQNREAVISSLAREHACSPAAAERLYRREVLERGPVVSRIEEMREAIRSVIGLRREMTAVSSEGTEIELSSYFDPSYVLEADPRLLGALPIEQSEVT